MVTGFEAREGELRAGGGEVVALVFTEGEEFLGEDGADAVEPAVARSGAAGAIAEEAGHGVGGAGGELLAEDVEVGHERMMD